MEERRKKEGNIFLLVFAKYLCKREKKTCRFVSEQKQPCGSQCNDSNNNNSKIFVIISIAESAGSWLYIIIISAAAAGSSACPVSIIRQQG